MKLLTITQAKPNPLGKDRPSSLVPPNQVAGEWVDFKNVSNQDVSLINIELHHIAYTSKQPRGVWEKVTGFKGVLSSSKVVRVQSGGKVLLSSLPQIDLIGADHHLFTEDTYVWNNDLEDSPRLVLNGGATLTEIDRASYAAGPQEGKILIRSGEILV
jgi:hypothetical protein